MSDSLNYAKFVKISLENLAKAQQVTEFTGHLGEVTQESTSKIIKERPRHTK